MKLKDKITITFEAMQGELRERGYELNQREQTIVHACALHAVDEAEAVERRSRSQQMRLIFDDMDRRRKTWENRN